MAIFYLVHQSVPLQCKGYVVAFRQLYVLETVPQAEGLHGWSVLMYQMPLVPGWKE